MFRDKYNLLRFVEAQDNYGLMGYLGVLRELEAGKKEGHWIWWTFPQLRGFSKSEYGEFYGISGKQEAWEYLSHPLLGPRLVMAVLALMEHEDKTLHEILGSSLDVLKFRSSMTLFNEVSSTEDLFDRALLRFCGGQIDEVTLQVLERQVSWWRKLWERWRGDK